MKKLTTEDFVFKAKIVHGNRYDYSKSVYTNSQNQIAIICPSHGLFYQKANNHLNGSDCYQCGVKRSIMSQRYSSKEFIEKARKVHNGRYNYSTINYINSQTKIQIKCNKCLRMFSQIPADHLRGTGCPICNQSKGELKIGDFFDRHNIRYVTQKTFSDCINPKTNYHLKFDFYIPSKNILIEFDGKQHFMYGCHLINFVTTKKTLNEISYKDKIKTRYAADKGISLIRIKYSEINRIEEILENTLK